MTDNQPTWTPKPTTPHATPREKSDKDYLVTLLLSLFLGTLGMHRFYVGKIATGLLMMFTLGGIGIWALIDFIIVAVGGFTDKEGKVIKS